MKENEITKKTKTSRRPNKSRAVKKSNTEARRPMVDKPSALDSVDRHNDPNWYFLNSDIARQVSAVSFNQYIGVTTDIETQYPDDQGHSKTAKYQLNVPSIMVLNANPSPGIAFSATEGMNLAMLKLYSTLSASNAKTTAYAPQDLAMLMLQLGEVISVMEHIRRAFGVAFTYSHRNRTLPKKLLNAMGFNPDDFLRNLALYRIEFNTWVTSLNRVPFLSNIAYFYKCADLYQRVYTDSTSDMAQIIIMRPYSTWVLDEKYNSNGSGLVTTMLPAAFGADSETTWSHWRTVVENMIEQLFTSSTFNYIYSDVLNFATKSNTKLFYLDYLMEGYTVVPEYNENFLLQVHNCNLTGEPYTAKDTESINKLNNVACSADRNMIKYSPRFKVPASGIRYMKSVLVDFPTPDPATEDIIEATRFVSRMSSVSIDTDTAKTKYRAALSLPDHYIVSITIFNNTTPINATTLCCASGDTAKARTWFRQFTSRLAVFDWAPIVYGINSEDTTDTELELYGDLNYYVILDSNWFYHVNDLTYLALFELRSN